MLLLDGSHRYFLSIAKVRFLVLWRIPRHWMMKSEGTWITETIYGGCIAFLACWVIRWMCCVPWRCKWEEGWPSAKYGIFVRPFDCCSSMLVGLCGLCESSEEGISIFFSNSKSGREPFKDWSVLEKFHNYVVVRCGVALNAKQGSHVTHVLSNNDARFSSRRCWQNPKPGRSVTVLL